jgi:hypothetical protein
MEISRKSRTSLNALSLDYRTARSIRNGARITGDWQSQVNRSHLAVQDFSLFSGVL